MLTYIGTEAPKKKVAGETSPQQRHPPAAPARIALCNEQLAPDVPACHTIEQLPCLTKNEISQNSGPRGNPRTLAYNPPYRKIP